MSKKFWHWIKNEATGERVLRLNGLITDEEWIADYFGSKTAKEFRAELDSGTGDIAVQINSEGGDVFAANEIYNMLKEYSGKVKIKIDALAASAASIIAMAGDEVEISPVGMIMIHNPFSYVEGDSEEMKTAARMLEEIKAGILNAYEQKTKLPREQLSQMMDAETWMHAEKAIELGFADKIIGEENFLSENYSAQNLSTRRQVRNCISKKIKSKIESEKKKRKIKVVTLRRHLNLY